MTFPFPYIIPAVSGLVDATSVVNTSGVSTSSTSTYNFTSVGTSVIGNRGLIVLIGASSTSTRTVSSVTYAGTGGTELVTAQGTGNGDRTAIWYIPDNSNTTGTLTISFSNGMAGCAYVIYSVYNLLSTTPTNTYISNAAPAVASMDISAGGLGFGAAGSGNVSSPTSTWSGLTKNAQQNLGSGKGALSGASIATASTLTGLSASCSYSNTTSSKRSAVFCALR